jgi:hypothetical protein
VALARSARYAAIAAIASYYGRHFTRVLQHPGRYLGWISLIAGAVVILIVAAILLRRRLEAVNERS